MNITKEQIQQKGYAILEAFEIDSYYKNIDPIVDNTTVFVTAKTGDHEEEGWEFTVRAPNWQFVNDQGLYVISFLEDGTPHRFYDFTGGTTLPLFLYQTTSGTYETYFSIEDIPD